MEANGSLERYERETGGLRLSCSVNGYEGTEPALKRALMPDVEGRYWRTDDGLWSAVMDTRGDPGDGAGMELTCFFQALGESPSSTVALSWEWPAWSKDHYVLVPGAVYAGNRFEARSLPYAPCWTKLDDYGPDVPTLITDVPRLSLDGGPSAFHLLTGDTATPLAAIMDGRGGTGWVFVTDQGTELGDTSLHLEESADKRSARFTIQAPGVRPTFQYTMATTTAPSTDRAHDFAAGQEIRLRCRVYRFPCESIRELYERLAVIREEGSAPFEPAPSLPLSAAWAVQERKYNERNWNAELGYYAVGTIDMKHQDWQIGWVGGGMSSYALLLEGDELSAERALETLRFMFSSQTEAGFFHGVCYKGQWYGDEFNDSPGRKHPERWHILRKSADALYFLMKHWLALGRLRPEFVVPEEWLEGTRRLADAFVSLWSRYGQFGQWVHTSTGELLIGGSAGGAIAPAGLALCARYFGNPAYLEVAQAAALRYYREFTSRGVTTGGPGEILQCPDSESAFALLESYIVLHEETGEGEWLAKAEEAALQAMTWCVSYDFDFPEGSTFERLAIRTTGSVIANVQNKHSAPGICTLSGDSLLKLYRATGNERYIRLLREIAGNLPQYLSREERPVMGWDGQNMPAGYMSERVNMSDWEGKDRIGEVIPYSCWCEASLMLAYAEVPGIYVDTAKHTFIVIDQVKCSLAEGVDGRVALTVRNPHPYAAKVKLLAEDSSLRSRPLGVCGSPDWRVLTIAAGGSVEIEL
ncbi:hypothetical protein [Paenibacillus soyae]|uniref:Uncharacterized protein n=1 Tax=Paenibacillus soyae TaxID=2969249 RepID=A0A9X2MUA5_9BACL|nr:hypothetical protein [Paenibacillus soyae]MCR2806432.1 hypothetical protein [Paenibacillus soyae]